MSILQIVKIFAVYGDMTNYTEQKSTIKFTSTRNYFAIYRFTHTLSELHLKLSNKIDDQYQSHNSMYKL